jgi:hypothetical protein
MPPLTRTKAAETYRAKATEALRQAERLTDPLMAKVHLLFAEAYLDAASEFDARRAWSSPG